MGLDIWFKEDIANILRAVDEANLAALAACDGPPVVGATGMSGIELRRTYRRGFVAALATLALALGLPPPDGCDVRAMEGHTVATSSEGLPAAPRLRLRGGKQWEE